MRWQSLSEDLRHLSSQTYFGHSFDELKTNFAAALKRNRRVSYLRLLFRELSEKNVIDASAMLAYYFFFALFPAAIFLLSILPFLPIENLSAQVLGFAAEILPRDSASLFSTAITEVTGQKRSGLLSTGGILTLWAASSGMYALMQQLNMTFAVKESRPYWRVRLTALLMTVGIALVVVTAFALLFFGALLETWLQSHSMSISRFGGMVILTFTVFRWLIILFLLLTGFALTYYFAPDTHLPFKFVTPGAIVGVMLLVIASLAFRFYAENIANYAVTYGSMGAVIARLLWLYISGFVILLGAEINALVKEEFTGSKNDRADSFERRADGIPVESLGSRNP